MTNSDDLYDIENYPESFRDAIFDVQMDSSVNSENFMEFMLSHYRKVREMALEMQIPNGPEYCDIHIRGLEAYFEMRRQRGA